MLTQEEQKREDARMRLISAALKQVEYAGAAELTRQELCFIKSP